MNGIIEALCHHISRKDQIVGIEADAPYAIVVYLADGRWHTHSSVALCHAQFGERRHDAEKMFPDIPWHRRGDPVPDWLKSFWDRHVKQRSRFLEIERELSLEISKLLP